MNTKEALCRIGENHFSTWIKTHAKVWEEFSDKQQVFCLCGKLATGLHERICRRFNAAVTKETLVRLKHLLLTNKTNKRRTSDENNTRTSRRGVSKTKKLEG